MSVSLSFHGAAGTVTGSCYRVAHAKGQFLVDCGMFQGNKTMEKLNHKPFPFEASALDFLLLTHAHIDHTGLLPKLAKSGFDAPLHGTKPTIDMLSFMLMDSAKIQESETERRNRKRERAGKKPLEPAYTVEDAKQVLAQKKGHKLEAWFHPGPGVRVRMWNAGHILGSASLEVEVEDKTAPEGKVRILFSGDLGPDEKVFYKEPDAPSGFDYVLCEGTYGDRERPNKTLAERREILATALSDGLARGGNVLIPAFSVERSQELLHDIGVLMNEGKLGEATVYLDSPLARKVTSVFGRYASQFDDMAMPPKNLFKHPKIKIVQSVNQSKAIAKVKKGAIILAASGMCEAGRIKHHLRNNLYKPEATVLFVGYQSPGTLGSLIQGAEHSKKQRRVFIHGRRVQVNAAVKTIGGYSAHADQGELLDWIIERQPAHCALFLTHADEDARQTLKSLLEQRGADLGEIILPKLDETFTLDPGKCQLSGTPKHDRIQPTQMKLDWRAKKAEFDLALGDKLEGLSATERAALVDRLSELL